MCVKQEAAIFTYSDKPLKLVDQFTYLGSNISSTEIDVNIRMEKLWSTIDKSLIIWQSDLSDKIKRCLFQAVSVPALQYGCTSKTQTKHMDKK